MKQRRNGYTLLELVAVMAILVVAGAICIPLIKPMLADANKEAAADVVRARWTQLRTKAMHEGRAYCFEFQPSTGKFRCVPDTDEDAEEFEESAPEGLPGGIKISQAADQPSSASSKGGWQKVATFLADGTVKQMRNPSGELYDPQVTISDGGKSTITLKLHSATGIVSAAEEKKR